MDKTSDVLGKRKEKLAELKSLGINLFPNGFAVSHSIGDIRSFIDEAKEDDLEKKPEFSTAGRIMAANRFGKTTFFRFQDRTGQLQAYFRKEEIGEEAYALSKKLDIGDFIGVGGPVFQTKTGEWTIHTNKWELLCKASRPLPEKYHKLKDPEKRYRQRYLDLIMNEETREIFRRRSMTVQCIRNFLTDREFMEVETPMMHPIAGGAEATPFVTHHNALDMDLFLRIAPELYLKRLVVGGFERVFEINRNFRNEGVSTRHNPEFTMLEFYQAYAVYTDLMEMTEAMIAETARKVTGGTRIVWQGHDIELGGTWRRMTMEEALTDLGKLPPNLMNDREGLLAFASEKGYQLTKTERLGKVLTKLFDILVEPQLIAPTFITGYPVEVSPLSRRCDEMPEVTERFELFIAGHEIANGFSELNDPEDQRDRFFQQVKDRESGNREAHRMDTDYIEALEYGMPPTAGEGIGIDRLVMLLTDSPSIREVILFPHMKSVEKEA